MFSVFTVNTIEVVDYVQFGSAVRAVEFCSSGDTSSVMVHLSSEQARGFGQALEGGVMFMSEVGQSVFTAHIVPGDLAFRLTHTRERGDTSVFYLPYLLRVELAGFLLEAAS